MNCTGKTSFLLTILDELILERGGSIIIAPASYNVAYCAHESWILNTSVKQNILIGRGNEGLYSIDEQRYAEVLRSCALSEDLSRWELGDETLLGEKGLNISGGQKARIALARALYSNAPILLLDNLMTSLDAETSVFVLKEAILRNCGDRLVILSSHQTSLMHYARGIIEVNEGVAVYHDTPNSFVMGDTLSSPLESTPVSTSDRRLAPSSVVLHLKNTKGIKSATVALPLDAYVSYVKVHFLFIMKKLAVSIVLILDLQPSTWLCFISLHRCIFWRSVERLRDRWLDGRRVQVNKHRNNI